MNLKYKTTNGKNQSLKCLITSKAWIILDLIVLLLATISFIQGTELIVFVFSIPILLSTKHILDLELSYLERWSKAAISGIKYMIIIFIIIKVLELIIPSTRNILMYTIK